MQLSCILNSCFEAQVLEPWSLIVGYSSQNHEHICHTLPFDSPDHQLAGTDVKPYNALPTKPECMVTKRIVAISVPLPRSDQGTSFASKNCPTYSTCQASASICAFIDQGSETVAYRKGAIERLELVAELLRTQVGASHQVLFDGLMDMLR